MTNERRIEPGHDVLVKHENLDRNPEAGALRVLAACELNYRRTYERLGGGHKDTGRAWDQMRRAGDRARELLG